MNQQQLVQDRIRKVVAIVIVIFLLFGLRLIDIQAIRAKGFVDRADNELSKSATLLAPTRNYLRHQWRGTSQECFSNKYCSRSNSCQ
jgi:hypothetical protein